MLPSLSCYQPIAQNIWQGRKDNPFKERIFELVKTVNLQTEILPKEYDQQMLIGFCCDEGIKRNLGRPGAFAGPMQIRQQLGKLAFHKNQQLLDLGNIICADQHLELAQTELSQIVSLCHAHQARTILMGGGHEMAWGHFLGLAEHYPQLGIINFDSHFDLRDNKAKQGNSGTPFRQIAQFCQNNARQFNYCCLGIQPVANTTSLFATAHALNTTFLNAEMIHKQNLDTTEQFLKEFMDQQQAIYLSICLDVFAECYAPGVSAPQPLGLSPAQVLPLIKYIIQSGKVISIDIAELSPPLDVGEKTARLAAMLIAEILNL